MNSISIGNTSLIAGLLLASAITAGCASGATRVEEDFGNSVRAMRQAQTMNPEASEDMRPIMQTDAQRMENALRVNREYVGDPQAITEDINLNIDTQN